jgi:ATP-dependent Clp protease ATP-binding subunit ClpC
MNKKIFSLDLTSLVAGTKYRGQFEERIDGLIKELAKNPDIIIFIDEIHTLVGTGNSSGSLDAANILKPALARGEIKCIGATTHEEFREHIEKDGALERRFQKVTVNPPTAEETKEILFKIKTNYEIFHKVTYSDEAINEIVKLSERYITGKNFPDKAIDVMDEVGSLAQITIKSPSKIKSLEDKIKDIKQQKEDVVKSQDYEKAADLRDLEKTTTSELEKEKKKWEDKLNKERFLITPEMVGEVVSNITGVPVSNINSNEIEKIINLEKELSEIVIGQEEAVKTISSAIKRNKTKIRHKNKPIGSFLFIGKSGVGKTYIAKQISKMFFGSEDSVVRIDMSEYSEKINISRLIGAPPGYVGYNEGGQLTKKIKNNPYSLILFDEIEKAHPDVHNLLLQVLDDGFLTDGNGKKIDFKNTIIVMTSNVGLKESTQFKNEIGYSKNNSDNSYSNLIFEKELKRKFSPEFLNRIDDIVYFNTLSENDILKIVDLQLNDLKKSLAESNYILEISDEAKEYIAKNGYDENYGVRNLNRYIQKNIEDKISDKILSFNMKDNLTFYLKLDEKNEIFIDVI